MEHRLHSVNILARPSVYTQQFAIADGICQTVSMKLKLKSLRSERKLTIEQLADLSGLSRGYISLLENGKRQPSAEALQSLAHVLRVRVTELIDEGDVGADLAALISIMSALPPEDRQEILREAASRLPRRAS